jgi:voltage-dependent calcium channel L type alpha-1D
VLGVQLFGGRFARCSDGSDVDASACVGWYEKAGADGAVALAPRVWANPPFGHFDDAPSAGLVLLVVASLEGWTEIMWWASDSTAPGLGPVPESNWSAPPYFIAWVLVGGFLFANLFISVVVDTFSACKQAEEGLLFMSAEQKQWVKVTLAMVTARGKPVMAMAASSLARE